MLLESLFFFFVNLAKLKRLNEQRRQRLLHDTLLCVNLLRELSRVLQTYVFESCHPLATCSIHDALYAWLISELLLLWPSSRCK